MLSKKSALIFGYSNSDLVSPLTCCHVHRKSNIIDIALPGVRIFLIIVSTPLNPASILKSYAPIPPMASGLKNRSLLWHWLNPILLHKTWTYGICNLCNWFLDRWQAGLGYAMDGMKQSE